MKILILPVFPIRYVATEDALLKEVNGPSCPGLILQNQHTLNTSEKILIANRIEKSPINRAPSPL